ncbi:MAG: formate dehydrogenase subunit delta [Sideroxydans sp.]|nr:formate dehydrogenase subunit delta [Sideroxydans sp.]
MNPANLIRMANQIGTFFEAMPNREQAVKDIAAHIQRNWEPRMRNELHQHIVQCGDAELSPIVRDALALVQSVG